ncbi:MAG: NfeD family protein [Alphaproteobacteria bacterium]|nr:NfeD family protein [Alphaproteobacteria bacterium]
MEWLLAHPFAFWMAAAGVLLAVEVATGSGWLLWPSGAAVLTAALGFAMPLALSTQMMIFAGLTIITTLAGRRMFPHATVLGGGDINDTRARLDGAEGVAAGDFAQGRGRVFVDGKEWAADLEGGSSLASGAKVLVTQVSGARLTVRPA